MFHPRLLVHIVLLVLALTSAACSIPLPLPQISQPVLSPTSVNVDTATPTPDPLMALLSEAERKTLFSTIMARMRFDTPVEIATHIDREHLIENTDKVHTIAKILVTPTSGSTSHLSRNCMTLK